MQEKLHNIQRVKEWFTEDETSHYATLRHDNYMYFWEKINQDQLCRVTDDMIFYYSF